MLMKILYRLKNKISLIIKKMLNIQKNYLEKYQQIYPESV